nr:uncharacterized protein LOC111418204 [Onthophagus taurus]
MAKIIIFVLAFVAFQGCFGKPADKSQLETLANNAKVLAENVTHTLGLNEISSEKVLKTLNDQAKTFSDNLNTLKARLDKEVEAHQGDVKAQLLALEQKITKATEDLGKVVDPDKKIKKGADEIKAQFDSSFKGVAESFDQLVKNLQPGAQKAGENVNAFTKSMLDSFLEMGKDIQTKFNKAVADHEKTH